MIKLMIVDDEAIIRESLSRFIDWQSIGVEVCATASNGTLAMASILNLKPDIILTDIRMPGLDGLELIRLLREQRLDCEVIFISAYANFEYARRALSLGAFSYVIKPINEEELLNTVEQCCRKLEEGRKHQEIISNYEQQKEHSRNELLAKLLTPGVSLTDEQRSFLSETVFPVSCAQVLAIGFWYDRSKCAPIPAEILSEAASHSEEISSLLITPADDTQLLILFSEDPQPEAFAAFARSAVSKEYFRRDGLIISLSDPHRWEQRLSDVYTESALTYAAHHIDGASGICTFSRTFAKLPFLAQTQEDFMKTYFSSDLEQQQIQAMLKAFVGRFIADGSVYDLDAMKLQFIHLMDTWVEHLRGYQLHSYLNQEILSAQKTISSRQSIDQIYESAYYLFWNITGYLEGIAPDSSLQLVRSSITYIRGHFGENISLTEVADYLHVSPNYLSKIFSAQMRQPFSKYLLQYRVERAIEYMKNPETKIYAIASVCGFSDVAYFSKAFKSVTGMSPQKYRNQHL